MRPVDSFLRSVRDAFQPAQETSSWVWVALLGCMLSAAGWVLLMRWRRRQVDQQAFLAFLVERHLGPGEAALVQRLAAQAGVSARALTASIETFERATAMELRRHPTPTASVGESIFAEVAALRRKLGFQQVGGNFALLTTREIVPGQIVKVAGVEASVCEVNEAFLAVEAAAATTIPVGASGTLVRVTFVHGQEARYESRCPLLARQTAASKHRLVLGHDEQPTRIQLRKSVRVTVRGPIHLHAATGTAVEVGVDGAEDVEGNGSLLDISVGGAALDTTVEVAVGSLVRVSFNLDGSAYHELLAHVLECTPRSDRLHHMRLEFRNLAQTDEHRLAASVARYSAKPFSPEPE